MSGRSMCALIASPGLICVAGCGALLAPHAVVENRFKVEYPAEKDEPASITVDVATAPVEDGSARVSITQLSDRGQAALIEQTKGKPPISITESASQSDAAVAIRNAVRRHLIVAVRSNRFLPPGDRVDAIRVSLAIPREQPGGWSITSWTQASNGETTIEVGKTTDVTSSKFTASAGTSTVTALPSATLGGEIDRNNTREADVKDTTDFDAAVDDDGQAWLEETAGWRVGLSHNLSMDVAATAPLPQLQRSWFVSASSLTREDPKHPGNSIPQSPDQVSINLVEIDTSNADTKPICGIAHVQYRIRHIIRGEDTFSESDDVVQPLEGNTSTSFLFAPAPVSPTYGLRSGGEVLAYAQGGLVGPVNFTDLSAATAFRDWLTQVDPKKGRLANAQIGLAPNLGAVPRPLTVAERRSLEVFNSNGTILAQAEAASAGACAGGANADRTAIGHQ
ncbi:MAG TPA: hypothetical protein VHS33_08120 [Sphingomicrobium sp.]|nr:hypothetical protein [Sphingomicrobium sp.]